MNQARSSSSWTLAVTQAGPPLLHSGRRDVRSSLFFALKSQLSLSLSHSDSHRSLIHALLVSRLLFLASVKHVRNVANGHDLWAAGVQQNHLTRNPCSPAGRRCRCHSFFTRPDFGQNCVQAAETMGRDGEKEPLVMIVFEEQQWLCRKSCRLETSALTCKIIRLPACISRCTDWDAARIKSLIIVIKVTKSGPGKGCER